jgi:AbrB family looped-hinge helix DNA binding protein
MTVIKVNKKYQITIPASVRKELNISAGDFFDVKITKSKDGVVYKRKRMSDEEIARYWQKRSQEEGESELSEFGKQELEAALKEVKEGKIKVFDSFDDFVKDLNK